MKEFTIYPFWIYQSRKMYARKLSTSSNIIKYVLIGNHQRINVDHVKKILNTNHIMYVY
jgi:hypothetical protein